MCGALCFQTRLHTRSVSLYPVAGYRLVVIVMQKQPIKEKRQYFLLLQVTVLMFSLLTCCFFRFSSYFFPSRGRGDKTGFDSEGHENSFLRSAATQLRDSTEVIQLRPQGLLLDVISNKLKYGGQKVIAVTSNFGL